eukprot:4639918-Amphidinium_carterae.1
MSPIYNLAIPATGMDKRDSKSHAGRSTNFKNMSCVVVLLVLLTPELAYEGCVTRYRALSGIQRERNCGSAQQCKGDC